MYPNESKYANEIKVGATPARQPVSQEVAQFAQNLASRAQALAEMVNGKLHPVMTSETPRPLSAACEKESVEYPPLFSDIRCNLFGIENALNSIEYALSRTEL